MGVLKPVFIHLGAHRTGTSSFQLCLHENRDRLVRAGIDPAYPGRDGIASGNLALRLPSLRHGMRRQDDFAERVREMVAAHSPDPCRSLLLSEENILGPMIHFFSGQFYPAADARLAALRQGLGAAEIAAVLVVRPYDELFRSAYRKRAEDKPCPPFAQIAPALVEMDRGWPDSVAAIQTHLAPARLTIVDYPARGASVDVLERLVPEARARAGKDPATRVNLSATDAALAALQEQYHRGVRLARREWKAVIKSFRNHNEDQGFARFTSCQTTRLRQRYDADLRRLANMPGVTLVA